MFAVSACFAADENVTLSEVDDEIVVDDVLSVEDDDALGVDDESSNVLGSNVVTNSTFHDYFDDGGELLDNVTADELEFEGDFTGIDVDTIAITKSIKFIGKNAIFNGVTFVIAADNVVIDGFKLVSKDKFVTLVGVYEAKNVTISNNILDFKGKDRFDSSAIYALDVDALRIINNNITYVGNSTGKETNNAIRVISEDKRSKNITVEGNTLNITMPSVDVYYYETINSKSYTDGVAIYGCDDVIFKGNDITLNYSNAIGFADTINVVAIGNGNFDFEEEFDYTELCKNVLVSDNTITAKGHNYIYGFNIVANQFNLTDNKLDISSDTHYAAALTMDTPSKDGYFANNDINVEAPNLAFGVYVYAWKGPIYDIKYVNNTITANAYAACGMEIVSNGVKISENTITLNGNYTTGIVGDMSLAYIQDNDIKSLGSNVGDAATGDGYIHKVSTGICVNDDNYISGNNITSTGIGIDLNNYGSGGIIVVCNNTIDVIATGSVDNYAIYVKGMKLVGIYENNITFVGLTDGFSIVTNAMYVANTEAIISGNTFNITLPSVDVAWFEIPPGSGNWVSESISEGIVIDSCDNITLEENKIDLKYGTVMTYEGYDTIYVVDVKDSKNAAVRKNEINGVGKDYIYGIIITGENFNISGNEIEVTSDYYANGIDIEGPASGVVEGNNISLEANNSVYGIYSGMNGQDVSANCTGNNIMGSAYNAFAFSLGDVESNIVDNKVLLSGNYTTGIAFRGGKINVEDNLLVLLSSEIGNLTIQEGFGVESVGIKVLAGNATITENRIGAYGKGIYIGGTAGLVDIYNNTMVVLPHEDKDGYAIYAVNVPDLQIHDNNLEYRGSTKGIGINNAVYLYNATSARIFDNEFDLELVSCYVPWKEIPAGSHNWVSFPVSEGIVIENSKDVIFDGNDVFVTYNNISGDYDTIYSVVFKNSDDAIIANNEITSYGNTYIYGISISGENFIIRSNDITSYSKFYANGIDIEGPATGVVDSNVIEVEADTSAYAIYSGMNGQNVYVSYTENDISGEAYNVFAFSLGDVESNIVDNDISLVGNYTTGIAFKGKAINIEDNTIELVSSEIGDMYVWEDFGVEAVGIKLIEGDATITGNIISTSGKGIYTVDVNSAEIGDNFIEVAANTDEDAYAIYAENVPMLLVYQNFIGYSGDTAGDGINNAVYLNNATSAKIIGNEFDLELVSCYVPWIEIPAGSQNWVSFPVSEGIVVENSKDVVFYENVVDVKYNAVYGAYDTIYAVDFKNSSNANISKNNITANGHSYVYGIIITSDNFTIRDNTILILSDNNYANGINPDAGASGIVENNTIVAIGKEFSYPVYSNMYGDVTNFNIDYIGNEIYGNARNQVVGLDLHGGIENVINNTIIAEGGYTCAINAGSLDNTISGNIIRSLGTASSDNTAITVSKGVANITDNYIESIAGDYAIDLGNTNSTVDNNYITGRKNEGRDAIANPGAGANIEHVAPGYKVILFALDAHYVYKDGSVYSVYALDVNGKPISGITIVAAYGFTNLKATTDANGLAKFTSDLDAGDHYVNFTFSGNDYYEPVTATGHIKVDSRSTEIVVPASTTVLLTAVKNHNSYITLTLKDSKGNLLVNRYVNIVFNGNKGVYVTDNNGAIKYLLDTSGEGTKTLTMSFDGDKNYLASSATTKVKFTKEASKLTAKKKTFKANKKTKKYTVTLKDSKNKGINKAKISLKIKGKHYDAKTNSKGKAVFKIKKLSKKGKYKAKVKYEGNRYYNAASKSVKITVK